MIAFASMFLGLVLGVQPLALLVSEPVAAVEIRLDGAVVARLTGEPWSTDCDFGDTLVPHLLEAVAFDAQGKEMGHARQWVNLPGPLAEARLVLDGVGSGKGVKARLVADTVLSGEPRAVRVTFDGRPLEVADPTEFELPPHDPERLHHLAVELEFSDQLSSSVETTFGGIFVDSLELGHTAIPVLLEPGDRTASAIRLQGRVLKDGEPLQVVAIDKGPAEVVVVRDRGAQEDLDRLLGSIRRRFMRHQKATRGSDPHTLRAALTLRKDQHLRLLSPFPMAVERQGYQMQLFPPTPHFTPRDGGFLWLTAVHRPPAEPAPQRLADAVAVAGMMAAARDRRRAVVLVLGPSPDDASHLDPALTRRYLESLHVPLLVWSPDPEAAAQSTAWGETRSIASVAELEREVKALAAFLDRQRIVWVQGSHLPQRITVAGGAESRRPAA